LAFDSVAYQREWRKQNREKVNGYQRDWYHRSKKNKLKRKRWNLKWRAKNVEHIRGYNRDYQRKLRAEHNVEND